MLRFAEDSKRMRLENDRFMTGGGEWIGPWGLVETVIHSSEDG